LAADVAGTPDLLQIAEQRLRDLLEETPIGHAELDPNGRIQHANAALSGMLGVSEQALIGRSWISLLAPTDRAVVGTAFQRLSVGVAPYVEGEHALLLQDGGTLPAYVFLRAQSGPSADPPGRFPDGGPPTRMTALVLDRSVRHAAFRALERSQRLLAAAERFAHLGSWQQDLTTGETTWSAELHRLLGAEPGFVEPGPETLLTLVHPDDRSALLAAAGEPEGPEDAAQDIRVRGPEGAWRTLSLRIRRVRDNDGRPSRIVGTALDVTETRQLEAQLRDARDLFASVLTAATEQAIIAMDAAGRIRVFNTGAERLLGVSAEEAIGSTLDRFLDPAELLTRCDALGVSDPVEALVTVARLGQPETRRWTARTASGDTQQLSLTVTAMTSADGPGDTAGSTVTGFIGVASDVTAQQRAEVALRSSEERFRLAFDNAPIGMALVSARPATLGRFLKVNYALCRLSGYALSDLLGADFRMLTESDPATSEPRQVADLLAGETSFLRDERRCRHADGHDIWIRMSASLVRDVDGEPNYCVLQIEDITARKDAEQRLIHQTLHDSLTGLPNRVLLSDHLAQALARAHRNGLHVGVLFVDLDNFKDVNDSLGHDAGDELLIDVARRLRGCLRDADTAARLGGDEFVVVCEDLATREEAAAVAERVEQALDIAIDVRGHKVSVSASLGVAISDGSDRADDMLRKADSAMYRAKEHGRGRYEVFNPDLQARALRQVSLEADLRRALSGDELRLYYQASYNLRRGTLVGVEALLRWQHPDRGLLAPIDFLDVAVGVKVEAVHDAEARTQGSRQQPGTGRRANEREPLHRYLHRAGTRSLPDHDVQLVVLHGGVEDFLNRRRQTMDLVDEQHLMLLKIGEHCCEIAWLLDHGACRRADRYAKFVADDVRQCRLAEPWRTVQQDVIERFLATAGRCDRHLKVVAHAILSDVLVERSRPQSRFVLRVVFDAAGRHQTFVHRINSRRAPFNASSNGALPSRARTASTAFSASGR